MKKILALGAAALLSFAFAAPAMATEAAPVVNTTCTDIATGPVGTNLNGLWTNVDTRSAGHVEYVKDAVHVWTDDATSQAKVSEGMALNLKLAKVGQLDLAWTGTTPSPGINLFVTFETGKTGILVYESIYGQDLWLANSASEELKASAPSHTGGNGSENHGTINEWLSVYPNAQVTKVAYSLGSGVKGDGKISGVTVGCTKYGFDLAVAPTPTPTETATPTPTVIPTVTPTATPTVTPTATPTATATATTTATAPAVPPVAAPPVAAPPPVVATPATPVELAMTGAESMPWVWAGLIALVLGGILMAARRYIQSSK